MSFLPKDCLCFDIGANIGQTAHQLVTEGAGHVISVEPCIENYLVCARRPKTTALLAACWSRAGIMEVSYAFNEPGWSSVKPEKWVKAYPDARWGPPQPVVAITIEMLREKYGEPFLIKVDVEGQEKEVLLGLSKPSPFLIFEFHGTFVEDALDCLSICQKLGYTKAHYVRENIDLATVPTTPIDEFRKRWLDDAPEWGNITLV